jgi:hypothetical protein
MKFDGLTSAPERELQARITELEHEVAKLKRELQHWHMLENTLILDDMVDTIHNGKRMSVGEYWTQVRKMPDPRREHLWEDGW